MESAIIAIRAHARNEVESHTRESVLSFERESPSHEAKTSGHWTRSEIEPVTAGVTCHVERRACSAIRLASCRDDAHAVLHGAPMHDKRTIIALAAESAGPAPQKTMDAAA